MKEAFTIYKLIILYILSKIDSDLPQSILENFILDKGYTTYFNFNQAMSQLLDAELIYEKPTHNTRYYGLTDDGKETIQLFYNELSSEIRNDIVTYLEENRLSIIETLSIFTDYGRLMQNEYVATCSVKENNRVLIELKLNVSTEKEARTICDNWKSKSSEIYETVIGILLKESKPGTPNE